MGFPQLITILEQTEHMSTLHMLELLTASLTPDGRSYIIIDSSSPSPRLGVPCLYLPLGTVFEKKSMDG